MRLRWAPPASEPRHANGSEDGFDFDAASRCGFDQKERNVAPIERPVAWTMLSMSIPTSSSERDLMLKRMPVTGVQLWPTQLYRSPDIKYRSAKFAADGIRKVDHPKFAPEIVF